MLPAYPQSGPADPGAMSAFIDGVIMPGLEKYNVPGAVFVFVKNGRIFYKKGYGLADLERKIPFDPDLTVVRVASNSKLVTATAVMQLVERGKLSLDSDVNAYLKEVKIPGTFPVPITLTNLLTHTAGFDERNLDTATLDEQKIIPLAEFMKRAIPERVMEPGTVTSYSNMGFSLAGYIVELVAGEPFHAYARTHILKPLGMDSSDFLPRPELLARMAVPYLYRDGRHEVLPLEHEYGYPAATLMTTGSDMARFMIAHLQQGRYGAAEILKPGSANSMHRREFSNHPALPGIGLGFIESEYRGERMIEHGGWVAGFKTLTALLPERNAGFFISYNIEYTGPGSRHYILAKDVQKAIIDRYYATDAKSVTTSPIDGSLTKRLEGGYRTNRISRKDLTKFGVFMADLTIRALDDGSITLGKDRYLPSGSLLFRKEDGSEMLGFREDASGRITHLFLGSVPILAFDRLAWYQTSAFHAVLIGFSSIVFFAAFVASIAVGIWRGRRGIPAELPVRWAWRVIGVVSFFNVFMLAATILLLLNSIHISFSWTLPAGLVELLALGVLSTALSAGFVILTAYLWLKGIGGFFDRAFAGAVCVAMAAFTWFMHYWNLLGFRLG